MAREPVPIVELRRALGEQLSAFRQAAELTQAQLARETFCDRTTVAHVEKGRARADVRFWETADRVTNADGALLAAFRQLDAAKTEDELRNRQADAAAARAKVNELRIPDVSVWQSPLAHHDDELAALELARRVAASDVGDETLTQLELIFDDLATAYPASSPLELLPRIRQQLAYVMSLMDARKTLAEHKRLLIVGGWLSLLAATVHIDLKQQAAASARLRTAASLVQHADFNEIRAWCYETEAWRVLTDGGYLRAVELSKAAQKLAPLGSSVAIQATAQEGRAWARLGQSQETYSAIDRVNKLVSPLVKPERAEHHYRYDPDKSVAYTATTLTWVGDPAGESYAREVISRLKPSDDVQKWPRRVASANLDLALTLVASNRLDESNHAAQQAISSGRIVPSNYWRAAEVVSAVESRQLTEAKDLREAYEEMRRA
ncbi:MAG: helix-turn-helix domain-containing protein [Pseudonocardiaceae bacterium]|nr:helix-turn-helix domain-containing protein [Pseudonocardiaceae bacterium]